MTLPDLIDLEIQIAEDREARPRDLLDRDRQIYRELDAPNPDDRHALLSAWLGALRRRRKDGTVGVKLASAYRLLGLALALIGLFAGWGTAEVALAYDGTHPVNIIGFLSLFVGLQLLLLVVVLALLPLAVRRAGGLGDMAPTAWVAASLGSLADVAARVLQRLRPERAAAGWAARWRRHAHQLRARRSLYRPVEKRLLYGTAQVLGVAFNVGALLGCLRLIAFSDLAFSWSTTLQLSPETLHGLVSGLALPWSWLAPDTVPSLELVEATRYSRLLGAYVPGSSGSSVDPLTAGGWWSFLVIATACYGLLPRAGLYITARIGLHRVLRTLPLDSPDVEAVVRRLTSPRVRTHGRDSAEKPSDAHAGRSGALPTYRAPAGAPAGCTAVLWRDIPAPRTDLEGWTARLGLEIEAIYPAGGSDFAEDRALVAALADGASSGHVVIFVEAWEAPDRALRTLIGNLRVAIGDRRHVVVALVDRTDFGEPRVPSDDDVAVWQGYLGSLSDPYLALTTIEGSP